MSDTTTDATSDDHRTVADLIGRAKAAMLTTTTADGRHVSRPMGVQEAAFDGALRSFAYEDSASVAQIRERPEVDLTSSDEKGRRWTSIAGRARVVADRAKAEELCSPTLRAWFPNGLETPGITLIEVEVEVEVEADSAEYWDAPTSTVAFVAGIVRAAATGNPAKDPIRTGTVEL